ncbi:MAG: POTRA domain-containing protein, partial [bacterium]
MQNKRNRWSQIILIGFLTVLFILSSLSLVLANNQGKITAIVVQGDENISKDLIISQIASNLGDVFSKENIENDMKAVYDLGYFKDVRIKLESFRDGYKVVFVVVENLPIKEISIEGNTIVSVEEIREVMVLREGQVFCQKILKNDVDRISQLYKDKGYLLINIKDINFDEEGKLWINISEGCLEKIVIEGNNKTKEKVITREITIKPGDLFNFDIAKKSLQKIYNLGYFEDVSMKLEPGSEEDTIVLVIKVIEKNTGKFGVGAG